MSQKKLTPPPMKRSVLLKLKLQSLFRNAKQLAISALSIAMILGSAAYLVIKAPEIHGIYLRETVGAKSFKIQGRLDGGGGTGFAMKAASGQSYIVTNSHVCEGALSQSEDKTSLLVVKDDGTSMRRRILENSDFTDLCLLEGLPGVEGLSLGNEPGLGETSYIVGHPRLRPLSVSKGEIVGRQDVEILDYILPGNPLIDTFAPQMVKDGKCDLPKNQLVEVNSPDIGLVRICLNVTKASYMSTILIFPGNSGSPMVDMWGRVQGVAFASDGTSWGYVVSRADLAKFLSRY